MEPPGHPVTPEGTRLYPAEDKLDLVLAGYLEEVQRRGRADREDWLARHPDLAPALRAFFADEDAIRRVFGPAPTALAASAETGGEPSTRQRASHLALIGRHVGPYEILDVIGRGGMGIVVRAKDLRLDRIVALKMILDGDWASEDAVARFRREAQAAAGLDHPGIVPVHEIGEHEGRPYYAMAFVAGESLESRLAAGPLPPPQAADLVRRAAEAMQHAHAAGVFHRDLKPANILLDEEGRPRITDFGLAKRQGSETLTLAGCVMGTPAYMSPEQATGRAADVGPGSDVYSLCAILYRVLVGHPPFQSADPTETLRQVRETDPVPPRVFDSAVPRDLETICLYGLRKDPTRRYPTARELAEDLSRWQASLPIRARRAGLVDRAGKWVRRRPVAAVTLGFGGLLLGILSHQFVQLKRAAERSEYRRNIAFASMNAGSGSVRSEIEFLRACPSRLRGWEWHYLARTAHCETGRLVGHGARIIDVDAARTGGRLVSLDERGQVRVWDPAAGTCLATFDGHAAYRGQGWPLTGCARLRPDGERVASAMAEGDVKVWNAATGGLLHVLDCRRLSAFSIAWSPDGRRIVARLAREVRLWDAESGALLHTLQAECDRVHFGSDGRVVLVKRGGMTLWDPESGTRETALPCLGIRATFVHGGLPLLAVASFDQKEPGLQLRVHEGVAGREKLRVVPDAGIEFLAVDSSGRHLAAATASGAIWVWRIDSGAEVAKYSTVPPLCGVAILPDGETLIVGSGQEVRSWRLPQPASRPLRIEEYGRDVTLSPDGEVLASVSSDGKVRLWGLRDGRCRLEFGPEGGYPRRIRFDPSSRTVATLCSPRSPTSPETRDDVPRRIQVREVATGRLLLDHAFDSWVDRGWNSLAVAPGGRCVALGHGHDVLAVDDTGGVRTILEDQSPVCTTFSPDGRLLAWTAFDGAIRISDAASGVERLLLVAAEPEVADLCFTPDGGSLAVLRGNGSVGLWETVTGEPILALEGTPTTEERWSVKLDAREVRRLWPRAASAGFSDDGASFVAGRTTHEEGADGLDIALRRWDARPLPADSPGAVALAYPSLRQRLPDSLRGHALLALGFLTGFLAIFGGRWFLATARDGGWRKPFRSELRSQFVARGSLLMAGVTLAFLYHALPAWGLAPVVYPSRALHWWYGLGIALPLPILYEAALAVKRRFVPGRKGTAPPSPADRG